jgi:sensor histidine kinase YesM
MAGCLLFMSLYATYHYRLKRDRSFLYYTLYVSSCFVLALFAIDGRFGIALLYPYLPATGLPLSPMLVFAFYLLFITEMLQLNTQHRVLKQSLRGLLFLLLLQQAIHMTEFFIGKPLFVTNTYYTYSLLPAIATLLLLLWLIIRSNSPVKRYLLIGSLSLIILSVIPLTTNFYIHHLPPRLEMFVNFIPFWAFLGLTVECFCFALALAYRNHQVELEKNQLQQNYTKELEEELAVRTKEIEAKNRELEAQHIKQLETAFEQKLAETETTALRAQMNPHFIFNCLNSIKFFALQNDGKSAAEYLTKFSKLIRLVLENSRVEKVLLANELEALELYLQMEAMRFNHKLHYQILVEEEIDVSFTEIPPLLIQPYVENAIWHGLMHKPEGGKVTVQLNQPFADTLLVTITDNGIGRAKAAQLKSKSATRHKSFGMKMTSERIHLINQLYQSQTQVQVHDLMDANGEPCGTEVVISIPI